MIKIKRAVFENKEHTAMTVYISGDGFDNLPYGVNLLEDDSTDIHKELCVRYRNGEYIPEPYVEPEIDAEVAKESIRKKRNQLISETDYMFTTDYEMSYLDRKLVKEYRQSLRDITKQKGFPLNVKWPKKPSFIK